MMAGSVQVGVLNAKGARLSTVFLWATSHQCYCSGKLAFGKEAGEDLRTDSRTYFSYNRKDRTTCL